jgi:hypothetical protein
MLGEGQLKAKVMSPAIDNTRPVFCNVARSIGPRNQFQPNIAMNSSASKIGVTNSVTIKMAGDLRAVLMPPVGDTA